MYCKNCGQKLIEGDKFCASCGSKVEAPAMPTDTQNSAFGDVGDDMFKMGGDQVDKQNDDSQGEEFNWNIHTFPGPEESVTPVKPEPEPDTIDFNWSTGTSTPEPEPKPEMFSDPEMKWDSLESATTDPSPATPSKSGESLEDDLFGGLKDSGNEVTKQPEQSDELDKFFTFNKKNEEFQKLLDKEYEKVKTGNILGEELDAASAVSEEKFATRQPEDPMEELFSSEGIVKGYQPKEVTSNVLDRIDAADAEKQAREDAARILEEERAKAAAQRVAEEEAQTKAQAELEARIQEEAQAKAQAEAEARLQAETEARMQAEAEARAQTEAEAQLQAQARAEAEAQARMQAEIEAKKQAENLFVQEPQEPQEPQGFDPISHIAEMSSGTETPFAEEVLQPEEPPVTRENVPPETIRAVDKAAILAGMESATKMVEADKAVAAEGRADESSSLDLPDFLGHLEENPQQQPTESPVDEFAADQMPLNLGTTQSEQEIPEAAMENVFGTGAQGEAPVSDAASIFGEGQEPVEENLFGDPGQLEEEPTALFSDEEDEEAETSGKGRVVLKVLLVILIILLTVEIAGVLIKVIAPTSQAAKTIDTQLTKVIQFFTGSDDQYSVLAETEKIRTKPMEDKTDLINKESGKNKDSNIAAISYNKDLKLDPSKKYTEDQLSMTQKLMNAAWPDNDENGQVYYDQAIVGTLIAYESNKVNMVNNNDSSVLSLMTEGTPLYKRIKKLGQKGLDQKFEALQIGEIRQAGDSYFVWVSERTKTSGNTTTKEKVYELTPAGKTMKMTAEYDI